MYNSYSFDIPEAINKVLENYKIVIVPKDSQSMELKHGRWVEHHEPYSWLGYTYWSCSECGFECGYGQSTLHRSNFCPHCGAKMDLE